MATIDSMLTQLEDYTKNANTVKRIIINQLVADKVLTKEQAEQYISNWQLIVIKNAWHKDWLKKFGDKDDKPEMYQYKLVKFEI